jgi:hypothetical protein
MSDSAAARTGQVLSLGSPLRIINAYSARHTSGHGLDHFLVIACGEHEIKIRSSPHGKNVVIMLNERELR